VEAMLELAMAAVMGTLEVPPSTRVLPAWESLSHN